MPPWEKCLEAEQDGDKKLVHYNSESRVRCSVTACQVWTGPMGESNIEAEKHVEEKTQYEGSNTQ